MAEIIWEYIPQEKPNITISNYSQTVQKFATDLLPKLSALETSRSSVQSDITSAKNEFNSANSGIGSSWTSSTGLKVKDTLSNVIIEGVTRIETSLSGSFKTLLDKLKELSIPIEAINKAIEYTNGLTHKAVGTESATDSDGKEYNIPHSKENDEVQINANKELIKDAILAVEDTIRKIAAASDGESLGIVGNVSNGGTLGAVTTMDLSNVDAGLTALIPDVESWLKSLQQAPPSSDTAKSDTASASTDDSKIREMKTNINIGDNQADGSTTHTDPMETINDFENNLQGVIDLLDSRKDFTKENDPHYTRPNEFFKKEEAIAAVNDTYEYQKALVSAVISGSITLEQFLQGCKNVQSVYHSAWWGGSNIFWDGTKYILGNDEKLARIISAGDNLSKNLMKSWNDYYVFSELQRQEIAKEVNSSNTVDYYLKLAENSTAVEDRNLYNRIAQEKTILALVSGEAYDAGATEEIYNRELADTGITSFVSIVDELKNYQTACTNLNDVEELVGTIYE